MPHSCTASPGWPDACTYCHCTWGKKPAKADCSSLDNFDQRKYDSCSLAVVVKNQICCYGR